MYNYPTKKNILWETIVLILSNDFVIFLHCDQSILQISVAIIKQDYMCVVQMYTFPDRLNQVGKTCQSLFLWDYSLMQSDYHIDQRGRVAARTHGCAGKLGYIFT